MLLLLLLFLHGIMDTLHNKTKNMSTCKSIGSNGAAISPPSLSSSLLEQYDTLTAKSYSFCHFLRNETHERTPTHAHTQCECGREKKIRRWNGGEGDREQHLQSTDKLQYISRRKNGTKKGSTMAIGAPKFRK